MKAPLFAIASFAMTATQAVAGSPETLPPGVRTQLPPGYEVLASAPLSVGKSGRRFTVVALGRRNEDKARDASGDAPDRPLLIFEASSDRYRLIGRNDTVVARADQGGQCDPFLDGDATIAVKGAYFTVQNGVACGQHWTDYITFRFDDRAGGFVFDNERNESWKMNPSNAPDAEALVRDGPQQVRRDRPGHVTPFAAWRPSP